MSKVIYVVKQTQPEENYFETTIRIYESKEQAETCARNLNKTYGYGCRFNEYGDYEETLSDDAYHYYEWESQKIDEHVDEVEVDPYYPYVLECWETCCSKNGSIYSYESTNEYVAKNGGRTKDINEAKKFTNWDDAWKFAHTLEGIGAYGKDIVLSISNE